MRSEAGLAMKRPFIRWRKFVPITGTFGRLTVIEFAGFHPKWNRSMWLVECTCGTRKVVLGNSLLTGHCTSCGGGLHENRKDDSAQSTRQRYRARAAPHNNLNRDRFGESAITQIINAPASPKRKSGHFCFCRARVSSTIRFQGVIL